MNRPTLKRVWCYWMHHGWRSWVTAGDFDTLLCNRCGQTIIWKRRSR